MALELFLAALLVLPALARAAAPGAAPEPSAAASAAAERRFSERCARKPFGVDQLLSDAALRADLRFCTNDEARELVAYASCRALQGAPEACSSLESVGVPFSGPARRCLPRAAEDRFAFLTLRGGDALGACRTLLELAEKRGPSVDKGCGALITAVRAGDVSASCAALEREGFTGPQNSCADIGVYWSGSPAACGRLKDAGSKRDCLERAALITGLRDPAKCPASPACRILTAKSKTACEVPSARFSRALCARVSKAAAEAARKEADEKKRLLQSDQQVKDLARKSLELRALQAARAEEKAAFDAAEAAKKNKRQFKEGETMKNPPAVKDIMKALEEGRPAPSMEPAGE